MVKIKEKFKYPSMRKAVPEHEAFKVRYFTASSGSVYFLVYTNTWEISVV